MAESSGARRAWAALGRGSRPVRDVNGVYHTWVDLGPDPVTGERRHLHLRAGGSHGFDAMNPTAAISRAARTARTAWLRRVLAPVAALATAD